ncbi:MAG: hypothetical protein D6820_03820, partial [Lentisphaerae bacterium]
IAEGAGLIRKFLEHGQPEAVVGVACFDVLKRLFDHLGGSGIPGLAVPIRVGDCHDGTFDAKLLMRFLCESSPDRYHPETVPVTEVEEMVRNWFAEEHLRPYCCFDRGQTGKLALQWLSYGGKRWRPILTVAAYCALNPQCEKNMSCCIRNEENLGGVRMLALGIECFHKASLIHDDIEDDDQMRYDIPTLHRQYGVGIAVNVGDYLIGEGYRLICESGFSPDVVVKMLGLAARCHLDLSRGQGAELCCPRQEEALGVSDIIDIFRNKTAPAFEAALGLGALAAGADERLMKILAQYSTMLGIAYQIQDDLMDYHEDQRLNDLYALRPTLLLALAMKGLNRKEWRQLWSEREDEEKRSQWVVRIEQEVERRNVLQTAERLLATYRGRALEIAQQIPNYRLRYFLCTLIRQVIRYKSLNQR